MPTTELSESDLTDGGATIVDIMMKCALAGSRGDARRLIQQGGVTVNGERVSAPDARFDASSLREGLKIRRGKKVYHRAILK